MQDTGRLRVMAAELIAALGLVFVAAGALFWATFVWPTTEFVLAALHELVMHVLFGLVILLLGIHTERSNLDVDERFDVMVWCSSGFVFLVALALWGELGTLLESGLTRAVVSEVIVFGSMGGAFGVVAGVNWGHSRRNRELAEVNEEQRETLVLLTRLLRHDIRNGLTVVKGHVELLEEHVDSAGESSLETMDRHLGSILQLLADTDTLIKTLDEDRELERINITRMLREEADGIDDEHDEVDVRTTIPDGLRVFADELVRRIFSNLLENAVAHNDNDGLVVEVVAERSNEFVEVVVSDNGSGIPEDLRDECFELGVQRAESSGDGLGLYLVSRLVHVYGGSISLEEATDGASFRVTLPAAA